MRVVGIAPTAILRNARACVRALFRVNLVKSATRWSLKARGTRGVEKSRGIISARIDLYVCIYMRIEFGYVGDENEAQCYCQLNATPACACRA